MEATQEQLLKAYEQAPSVIKHALSDGVAVDFIVQVKDRYGLHVDVAGKVTEYVRNMILGLMQPAEFVSSLVSMGVPDAIGRKLVSDLNREVFIPLRDEVRKDAPSQLPSAQTPSSIPLVEKPAIIAPKQPLPAQQNSTPVPEYNLIRPQKEIEVRTMAQDMAQMQDKELDTKAQSPASPFKPITHTIQSDQATPARTFQTGSIPVAATPAKVKPFTQKLPEINQVNPPNPAPVQDYKSDPYREPI